VKVFVTGIAGFIGSALAEHLSERGHNVIGSVSSAEKMAAASRYTEQCFVMPLNEEFDPNNFRGVNTMVHCAHDLRAGKSAINKEGTEKFALAAMVEGVKHQVYIGSYSAHEQATSEYGKTKLVLEKFFLNLGQTVVKPGVVVGNGGIFQKMSAFVQKYPVVPLIDGGRGRMPIVGIRDLTGALAQLVEQPRPGCFRLYNEEQVTFKELLDEIKKTGKSKAVTIAVPYQAVYVGLWLAGKLRLPLQVDLGNLQGFKANQSIQEGSDLDQFIPHPSSLSEVVMSAVHKQRRDLPKGSQLNDSHN
jgi:NADH dehydrogenase